MNRTAMAQRCLTAVVRTGHYQRSKGLLHDPWSMNLPNKTPTGSGPSVCREKNLEKSVSFRS